MKKFFLSLLLVFVSVIGADARVFALIAGVSNYGNEDANLHQTTIDAKRFKEIMETQTKDITLLTSKYVTKSNLLEKLRAIANRAQKGDRIIFFYSGHGSPGALYGYDGPIPYNDILNILSNSEASDKICFIDACYAGTVANASKEQDLIDKSLVKAINSSKDQAFFVSCRDNEISYEDPFVHSGYFTQGLIKGIKGLSDENHDKNITVLELFKYLYNDVVSRSENKQHPQLIAPESMHNRIVAKW